MNQPEEDIRRGVIRDTGTPPSESVEPEAPGVPRGTVGVAPPVDSHHQPRPADDTTTTAGNIAGSSDADPREGSGHTDVESTAGSDADGGTDVESAP